MTLRASLLRELVNSNLDVGGRAELCCKLAKEFENKGEYEEAREMLHGLWPRMDQRPRVKGLEPDIAAEVLLRAGVLTGWIGSEQEQAKDFISESLTIFESRKYKKKTAEAQTELALCYMRLGEYDNASDLLHVLRLHRRNEQQHVRCPRHSGRRQMRGDRCEGHLSGPSRDTEQTSRGQDGRSHRHRPRWHTVRAHRRPLRFAAVGRRPAIGQSPG